MVGPGKNFRGLNNCNSQLFLGKNLKNSYIHKKLPRTRPPNNFSSQILPQHVIPIATYVHIFLLLLTTAAYKCIFLNNTMVMFTCIGELLGLLLAHLEQGGGRALHLQRGQPGHHHVYLHRLEYPRTDI